MKNKNIEWGLLSRAELKQSKNYDGTYDNSHVDLSINHVTIGHLSQRDIQNIHDGTKVVLKHWKNWKKGETK
mgnify:CR=1 FL=1